MRDTIKPSSRFTNKHAGASLRFILNRDLYFFRFVKEQYSRSTLMRVECSELKVSRSQRSTPNSKFWIGGGERDRTDDPLLAKQVLSQLSYTPEWTGWWVWLDSNQRPPPYQDGALTN